MLSQRWSNDPALIGKAFNAVRRGDGRRGRFQRESAMHYLVRCSPKNSTVLDFVRQELKEQYPFGLAHDDIWDCIAPFAIEHSDIRASVIDCVRAEFGRHSLHNFQSIIVKLGGDELRDTLIEIARNEKGWNEYWAVRPLVEGWGRSDPIVACFMDEIASWDDKKLENLAAVLPQILTDFDTCRTRLLSLARVSDHPRFDQIARGLAALGCTAADMEVVDTLLAAIGKGAPLYDPGVSLLTHFSANPLVRKYAQKALSVRDPPLGALARAYENDAGIRSQILAYANPLPVTLRADIAEVAAGAVNSHPAFERILKGYDIEADSELKIAASIHYHRHIALTSNGPSADHLKELVDTLHAVGPDLHERRAAAFAGMLLSGHLNDIVPMIEYGDKPLHIRSGTGHGSESDGLMALMCERWQDVHQVFGAELSSRFGDFGVDDGHLWDCLAPHINASTAARRDFLAFCNETNSTLGLRSLIALAREQPSSELLLDHCWRVFGREVSGRYERHSSWAVERIRLEIAYIFRDHFRERADVKQQLREAIERRHKAAVVSLVLVDANDPLFDRLRGPKEICRQFSDWVIALHLASARSAAEEFVEVTLAMINRNDHGIWDFQEITNRAVVERLQRDPEAVRCLRDKLVSNATESEIGSLPSYLMAAGALDEGVHAQCRLMLQNEARYALPRAGYDAVVDSTRAVSLSLLEALAPSFSP
jgi:hypothetical protein